MQAVWNGTPEQAHELGMIVSRNCMCGAPGAGNSEQPCGPHQMMVSDQRALDGLLFARSIVVHLVHEEFDEIAALSSEPC
jgi:hypothetical protein